jgi:hypothetical protein
METIFWIIVCAMAWVSGYSVGTVLTAEAQNPALKAQRWTNIKAAIKSLFRRNTPT